MKKIYITPEMMVARVMTSSILCGSAIVEKESGEYNDYFHSREFDFNDDEIP